MWRAGPQTVDGFKRIGNSVLRHSRRVAHGVFFLIFFLSCERAKGFWNILKTDIKESLMPKYPNIGKDPSHISVLLHSTVIFDMMDAATAGGRFLSIISSAAASKNPKADTSAPS